MFHGVWLHIIKSALCLWGTKWVHFKIRLLAAGALYLLWFAPCRAGMFGILFRIVKLEKAGTYWEGFPLNNLTKEGGVLFPQGKKPEALIQKVFDLATGSGDWVLDSFGGSGTTGAVAHKMGRRWIMVEIRANIRDESVIEHSIADEFIVFGGFTKTVFADGGTLPLREQISQASEIRRYIFTGITKSLFDCAAFDSTPEKTLAEIMEDDKAVLKWLRPPLDQLPIFFGGRPYNVDFVAETDTTKYLLEVKERKAIYEGDVLAKAKAATKWCEVASKADKQKPWEYKLIPEDAVKRINDFKFTIAQAVTVS